MPFRLRQISPDDKLDQYLMIPAFLDRYPVETVGALLSECRAWEQRDRKLNMLTLIYEIMAFSLLPRHNSVEVLEELASGLRYVWPDEKPFPMVTKGAISQRRKQLPVTVMRLLFRRSCRPLATIATKGAFAGRLRIMAIDGTTQDVAEWPDNALHFGRISSGPAASAFPQMRAVYLAECGTHAVTDAVLARCGASETTMAWELLRSIEPEMLVTMDKLLFSARFFAAIGGKGAHALSRLESTMLVRKPALQDLLPDGSWLFTISPKTARKLAMPLRVRIIPYRISAPEVPGYQQEQRLVTTLLDPEEFSAQELVDLYHERWEVELIIDEQKTHQRLSQEPLRSRTPQGCYQEMYGLLMAHYAIRALMHEAAVQAEVNPDRLSFTHAVHVVCRSLVHFGQTDPLDHPALKRRLLIHLREQMLSPRILRFVPRVVKRPLSSFRRKRWWHQDVHLKGLSVSRIFLI